MPLPSLLARCRQPRRSALSDRADRLKFATVVLHVLVVVVVLTARVRDVASDPRATLMITQVLLKHGTLALDSIGPERIADYGSVLMQYRGHTYSAFPVGTSLLAIPFVALANAAGLDMSEYTSERLGQVIIAALVAAAELTLLIRLARRWLSRGLSLAVAAVTWFGSSLASTQATALWSHDFATLLGLLVLQLSIRPDPAPRPWRGPLVGGLLFLAYLCRPTMSLLAPPVLIYNYLYDRKAALQALLTIALGGAAFMAASLHWYGDPLPPYYRPQRLKGSPFGTALLGNTLSPSRGFFVYSPFFLVPILLAKDTVSGLRRDKPLVLVAVAWPLAHVLLVSRLRHWWAGYSYGPRFWTDALPGLFVLLCVSLSVSVEVRRRTATVLLATLGAFACFVHTVQGLYNRAPKDWNAAPSIDRHPELVFDWRYPQFLHTAARQRARVSEWALTETRSTAPTR